jgi:SMODS and SLOG-associating 2TM effector domain family 5
MTTQKSIPEPTVHSAPQPYLDSDFSKELSFQLWITKGARFNANRRLLKKNKWSTYALTALSTYAIVLNLMVIYGVLQPVGFTSKVIAFGSTAVSIMLLIVSILESARKYEVHANNFHRCALELSHIYRKLRILRTGPEPNVTRDDISNLSEEYEKALACYDNHDDIDYQMFQANKYSYFQVGFLKRAQIKCRYYFETLFTYHVFIFLPPLLAFLYFIRRSA